MTNVLSFRQARHEEHEPSVSPRLACRPQDDLLSTHPQRLEDLKACDDKALRFGAFFVSVKRLH